MNKYILHSALLTPEQLIKATETLGGTAKQCGAFCRIETERTVTLDSLNRLRDTLNCDINKIPEGFNGKDVRLVVTDMDSTLIAIECIDEIADMLGIKPEVSAITESAMRGEIGFEASLTQRVALLKGLPVSNLQRVYDERLKLNPGAELLIAYLKKSSIKLALVSGGFTFFTDKLKQRLNIDYTLANVLDVEDGLLTGRVSGDIVGAESKATLLLKLAKEMGLETHQIVAMGDGANDLVMMKHAGLSVAYHAKPTVQEQTNVQINKQGLETVIDLLSA